MRYLLVCFVVLLCAPAAIAQENTPTIAELSVIARSDAFGQTALFAEGLLVNATQTAFTGISLFAEVYDAGDELIGEGFGYPVTACGAALVSDFVLNPDHSQAFSVLLELYDDYESMEAALAAVDHVDILPQFSETAPTVTDFDLPQGMTRVSDREVVMLEWIDEQSLRFGIGCANAVFTELDWYEYNLLSGETTSIEHPRAAAVTPALLRQTGINQRTQSREDDPTLYFRSFLTFSPTARRVVWQNDLNVLWTAEPDGSFKRIIDDNLYRNSLQGFIWLPEGRFIAYYFGAYGEPVLYLTATVDGQRISGGIFNNTPSFTVPGAAPDARRVIISAELDGVTGYYLSSVVAQQTELLFATDELPGNNFPAPVYAQAEDNSAVLYFARPVDGEPRLQCFNAQTNELVDNMPLPLRLTETERAWWWLSPDRATLALGANGTEGGLWLIDLAALDCGA